MKKTFLILAAAAMVFTTGDVIAKKKKTTSAPKITLLDSKDVNEVMKFDTEVHDFGTIQEGDEAKHIFKFVNYSKEPIVIQNARASCGCTTPSYSKEPIKPGGTGSLTVVYNTKNRPGAINKSVTVTTNLGNKILKITGKVNPQPKASAPAPKTLIKK